MDQTGSDGMKATPIAEFLARKATESQGGRATAAAPSNPFTARRVSAVNDDPDPDFRRSGLVAALARRSPETPPLVRPLEAGALPQRREPPPRPAPPPLPQETPEDVEQKLSEAYHRGVQEGLDAGKAEAATARALERAEMQKRAVVEKLDFQMNEYARLSESLGAGFAELERRVAQATAQLLKPLLREAVSRQIVEELSENVARLTRAGGVGLLKVRGPERLLNALKGRIESLAVDVEYVEEEGVEISVLANSTEIRSELQTWSRLIEDIVENG
jgi:hypothetical protein